MFKDGMACTKKRLKMYQLDHQFTPNAGKQSKTAPKAGYHAWPTFLIECLRVMGHFIEAGYGMFEDVMAWTQKQPQSAPNGPSIHSK